MVKSNGQDKVFADRIDAICDAMKAEVSPERKDQLLQDLRQILMEYESYRKNKVTTADFPLIKSMTSV